MFDVIKKKGKKVLAYRLGEAHPVIDRLVSEEKILPCEDGSFEIMSLEAYNGGSGKGQSAQPGDYIKLDDTGFPIPITRSSLLPITA